MQNELIIVSEYCHKCQIEPSFIDLLQEEGLIEIRTEGDEHYLLVSQLPEVERYSRKAPVSKITFKWAWRQLSLISCNSSVSSSKLSSMK